MEPDAEADERTPLITGGGDEEDELIAIGQEHPPSKRRHRRFLLFLAALLVIAVGNVLAVYFVYYRNCIPVHVVSLNVWGMPGGIGGCKDKAARIKAISKLVSKGDFDVMTLQELWMQADHEEIAASIPKGFHITAFR